MRAKKRQNRQSKTKTAKPKAKSKAKAKAKEEQTLTQHILERRIEMGLGEKSSEKESSEGSWPLS